MAEYIDREKLPLPVTAWGITDANAINSVKQYTKGWNDCLNSIKDIPSADVVERKHGKWEDGGFEHATPTYYKSKICSICGYPTGNVSWSYCPICGAKMRGE